MKCPACQRQLSEMTAGEVKVNACVGGCGGVWFDRFELKKMADPDEAAGESLLELNKDPSVAVDHQARKYCPVCPDMVMMRHFFSPRQAVEVDECPQCGGHWLDSGELGSIRSQYGSEEERVQAAQEYFAEIYDNQLAAMARESRQSSGKIKHIAGIFRFITPSWYLRRK